MDMGRGYMPLVRKQFRSKKKFWCLSSPLACSGFGTPGGTVRNGDATAHVRGDEFGTGGAGRAPRLHGSRIFLPHYQVHERFKGRSGRFMQSLCVRHGAGVLAHQADILGEAERD